MKRALYILYIVLAVSLVDAALINVTTFTDGSSNFNITQNTTKEIYVGQGITALNANISFRGYMYETIYQETANKTDTTVPYLTLNYTKPQNTTGAIWKVKHGNIGIYDISIPSSCWNAYLNDLMLRIFSSTSYGGGYESQPSCYNGTSWIEIGTKSRFTSFALTHGSCTSSVTNLYDGDWSTEASYVPISGCSWWGSLSVSEAKIYEEGINWIIQNNITNPKVYLNESLIFSHTGNYNTTNNSVSINLTELNYYLKNNGTVPLTVKADAFSGDFNIFDLSITYTDLSQCVGADTQTYNITLYDEDNQTELLGKLSIDVTYGDNVLTFQQENTSSIAVCLSTNNTYIVSGTIYSETDEYLHKKILVNTIWNNVTQYARIYNSYSTDYSSLSYYLKKYNYENYQNVIGRMQRYYPLNHSWTTVQEDRSDQFGRLMFDVKEVNTEYRFLFYDSTDALLDTTSTLKFVCVNSACDVTSVISEATVDTSAPIVSSSTYNNATNMVTVTWNDPSTETTSVNVLVNQVSFTEIVPICNYLSFSATGSYNCNVTGYTGNIQSIVVSNSSLSNNQISSISYFKIAGNYTIGQLLDVHDTTESSWWSFVIIVVFVGIGMVSGSPLGILVMVFAAVFFIGLLGLSSIVTLLFLGGIGTMAIFIGSMIKRN